MHGQRHQSSVGAIVIRSWPAWSDIGPRDAGFSRACVWHGARPCARSAHPAASPTNTQENRHWYLQTVQYHPLLGWSGYPNFVATKDGIPIQTNSLGYRDREPVEVEDDQKLGVLFLGDSFTWGDEVRLEERFTSLLEASCGFVCDRLPALRAINKGIIGYGTAQSLLDYVLARDERPFEVVILALYTGNDLTDNAAVDSPSGPRPRLIRCDRESAGQDLCLEGVPIPPVVDWPEHRLINPRGEVARTLRLERPDHVGKPAPCAPVSHREADRRPDGRCVERLAVPDRRADIGGSQSRIGLASWRPSCGPCSGRFAGKAGRSV